MTRKQRQKRGKSRQSNRRKIGGAGLQDIPTSEPRTCACPRQETFWVTLPSSQIYAFPACRKHAFDARKKRAFYDFLRAGLLRIGATLERAEQVARCVLARWYTRTMRLVESCGWAFNGKQWVKGAAK